ncbi:DUF2513 domain-containing protein, partial [Bacillus subtilis]
MKRNIELQKEILLFLEEKEDIKPLPVECMNLPSITVEDTTDPNFIPLFYQVKLLKEEGLIEANISNGDCHTVFNLTSSGQDKVQFIKNDTLFNRTLDVFKKQALPITITLLADYAKSGSVILT